MIWKDPNDRILVEAYAALLQKYCDICVTSCDFFYGGWNGPIADAPCSLLTVEPYCPDGKRCLALNSRHPLIITIAKYAAVHCYNSDETDNHITFSGCFGSDTTCHAANRRKKGSKHPALIPMIMGEAMISSASWPAPGLDLRSTTGISWNTSASLICGPHFVMVCPVPHLEVALVDGENRKGLAVYPQRIIGAGIKWEKGDRSKYEIGTKLQGEVWKLRDNALWDEWNYHVQNLKMGKLQPPPKLNKLNARKSCGFKIISYSPCLPILLLAQLIHRKKKKTEDTTNKMNLEPTLHVPRSKSMGAAASVLLSCDRLFCLTLFFGVPLIDRTNTLHGSLRTHSLTSARFILPTKEEVEAYQKSVPGDAHKALDMTMLNVAESLWDQVGGNKIMVAWSGGIDSTGVLVALLRTANNNAQRLMDQLVVILDDVSITENPHFYEKYILGKITVVQRNERSLSEIAEMYEQKRGIALLVTGELGDQIFGSAMCRIAFPQKPVEMSGKDEDLLMFAGKDYKSTIDVTLDQPWEEAMLKVLEEKGLLAGSGESWKRWIAPQLEQAPFPILSLYDLLWWLNFSCKWQDVSLRCLNDGGNYQPNDSMTGIIHHFYGDSRLQCWASIREFHDTKFEDLREWRTYKEPLKHFIHSFDKNREYYVGKEKVESLCFDLDDSKLQSRTHSGLVTTDECTFSHLVWGNGCLHDCSEEDISTISPNSFQVEDKDNSFLGRIMLQPWILKETRSTPPMMANSVTVNPWKPESNTSNPFDAVPAFVEDDERKERIYNPVTAITMHAKCAALLEPDFIKGKTVLDLGACLGSMLHWCLFHGALKTVGVEPQNSFCERMQKLLESARHTWPNVSNDPPEDRFEVVCSDARKFLGECQDQSYDIVIAAGVLHCFHDPINILAEICRVAKEAVFIESVHTTASRAGAQQDYTGSFEPINHMELAPAAQVNVAKELASITGLAVVPSKALIEEVMHVAGFDIFTVNLSNHPTKNRDIRQYNESKRFHKTTLRFFLRCIRRSKTLSTTFNLLENAVVNGENTSRAHRSQWKGKLESWNQFHTTDIAEDEHNSEEVSKNPSSLKFTEVLKLSQPLRKSSPCPFVTWDNVEMLAHKVEFDANSDPHPFFVSAWGNLSSRTSILQQNNPQSTTFGFVYSGATKIKRLTGRETMMTASQTLESFLSKGMFFSCSDKCSIEGGSGFIITVHNARHKKKSMFTIGGPLQKDESNEYMGNLAYIDGCSDSILIHPTLFGYPCLNHLHFPKNVKQTQHTHPSGRAGIVFQGSGHCVIIDKKAKQMNKIHLKPGMVFVIPKDAPHAFETTNESTLDVIAFHPDSDYGPTNTNHPMVNRTIVDGVSASKISSIQTSADYLVH